MYPPGIEVPCLYMGTCALVAGLLDPDLRKRLLTIASVSTFLSIYD